MNITCRDISKIIHNRYYTDSEIDTAIATLKKNGVSETKIRKLRFKKFFHRRIKSLAPFEPEKTIVGNPDIATLIDTPATSDEILLISHEMSLTGAPRALLTLAVTLKDEGYRPTILTLADGSLSEEARKNGIPVLVTDKELVNPFVPTLLYEKEKTLIQKLINRFPKVVYNTIVSVDMFHDLIDTNKSVIWIHEAGIVYDNLRSDRDKIVDAIKNNRTNWVVGAHALNMLNRAMGTTTDATIFLYGIPPLEDVAHIEIPELPHDKINIMISGMMSQRKGTDTLLGAIKTLSKEEADRIMIHIVGGSCESNITREINKAHKSVKWWGEQSHDFVLAIMKKMDMLICPSIYDPMPIVCTEAFQQSIPVVTSDATGTAALITPGVDGMIFEAGKSDAVAKILRQIIAIPPAKLKDMGKNGNNIYRKNFTLEVFKKNVEKYFPPIGR